MTSSALQTRGMKLLTTNTNVLPGILQDPTPASASRTCLSVSHSAARDSSAGQNAISFAGLLRGTVFKVTHDPHANGVTEVEGKR
jgi:hypothetical protein